MKRNRCLCNRNFGHTMHQFMDTKVFCISTLPLIKPKIKFMIMVQFSSEKGI